MCYSLRLRITEADIKYSYFVTSSELHDKTNCTALAYKGCTAEKNLHTGTPRNDMYFSCTDDDVITIKEKYSVLLGFDPNSQVIIYLPTYRRTNTHVFSFTDLEIEQRKQLIGMMKKHNFILIEKSHVAERNEIKGGSSEFVIRAPSEMNVQEMMLFADIVISDYSGAYLDFIILDRPVIHYVYDYEYYKNVDSGLYYEIEDFTAGPIAYDFESLIKETDRILRGFDDFAAKRHYVLNKYMSYETGHASEQIVNSVIGRLGD